MKTEEVATAKAPFFVYSNQAAWETVSLPSSVKDLKELEKFIDDKAMNVDEPFVFKIEGKVEYADIHLVNLAKGSIVKSPDDAHKGQVNCQVQQTDVQIIGFFSRKHQAVFTHHDTFMHLHLITNDRKMMGHLDDFKMEPSQLKLLMPAK
jgi:acetolactate decarboxylase